MADDDDTDAAAVEEDRLLEDRLERAAERYAVDPLQGVIDQVDALVHFLHGFRVKNLGPLVGLLEALLDVRAGKLPSLFETAAKRGNPGLSHKERFLRARILATIDFLASKGFTNAEAFRRVAKAISTANNPIKAKTVENWEYNRLDLVSEDFDAEYIIHCIKEITAANTAGMDLEAAARCACSALRATFVRSL